MLNSLYNRFFNELVNIYVELAKYIKPIYICCDVGIDMINQIITNFGYESVKIEHIKIPNHIQNYDKEKLYEKIKDKTSIEYINMIYTYNLIMISTLFIFIFTKVQFYRIKKIIKT